MTSSKSTAQHLNLAHESVNSRPPRICMPTWRRFKKYAFQGAIYEAQDVLCEIDDVDMMCPEPGAAFQIREALQRRLIWRDFSGSLAYMNPGLQPVRLHRDYDLFVAVCQSWWDMLYINSIKGWKDRCRTSVCWFDELWAHWIPHYKFWMHALKQFDYVVLAFGGSVEPVANVIGRPCHWVPSAIDAIRFSPYPNPPDRVVDVYSIGKRFEGVHQSLLGMAGRQELFYLYDTFPGSMAHPPDHRQHRELLASAAKRSRFFCVGPAKMGDPEDCRGQLEPGYRYFEGAAAGAVMIGQAPDSESFRHLFGWQDVVIELRPDGSDVAEVLATLAASPGRVREIGRRNAQEALLRHDWVYRWKQILKLSGLRPTPALEAREQRLKDLAGCVPTCAA